MFLFWFCSFTCTVQLLLHSFLEMGSFKVGCPRSRGQKKFGSRWTGEWKILKIRRFSRMLYVYRPLINFIDEEALLESRPPILIPFYFLVRLYESIWIPKHSHRRAWKENKKHKNSQCPVCKEMHQLHNCEWFNSVENEQKKCLQKTMLCLLTTKTIMQGIERTE